MSAVKLAAVPALAATGLGLLALPALALLSSPQHPGTSAAARDAADDASACQAWKPVLPGLLYLGTAPVLTIGGVPLLGRGSCLPGSGKGYDIAVGANVALPPQSICDGNDAPLPLLQLNLGVAIGVPDEDGYDPCQTQARVAGPAQAAAPRVVAPQSPHVVAPHVVAPHVVAPQPPHVVAPQPPQQPHIVPPQPPRAPRQPQPAPPPSSALGSPPPIQPPPPASPKPIPTTPAPPPATTPAAVVPPPRKSPPPPRPRPVAPLTAPAVVPPVTVVAAKPEPKPHPHAKPAPAAPPPPFKRAAVAQQPAAAYKPGQPALPVGVLVTVVMTPCVATVAARLGKVIAGA